MINIDQVHLFKIFRLEKQIINKEVFKVCINLHTYLVTHDYHTSIIIND